MASQATVFRAGKGTRDVVTVGSATTKGLVDATVAFYGLATDDVVVLQASAPAQGCLAVSPDTLLPSNETFIVATPTAGGIQRLEYLAEHIQEQCPELGDVTAEHQVPPEWAKDTKCYICEEEFAYTWLAGTTRHHCRQCGRSVCEKCAPSFVPLPHFGSEYTEPQRVCTPCCRVLPDADADVALNEDVAVGHTRIAEAERYLRLAQDMTETADLQIACVEGLNTTLLKDAARLQALRQEVGNQAKAVVTRLNLLLREAAKDAQTEPKLDIAESAIEIRYRSPELTDHAALLSSIRDEVTKLQAASCEVEEGIKTVAGSLSDAVTDVAPALELRGALVTSQQGLVECVQNHTSRTEQLEGFVAQARQRMPQDEEQSLESCLIERERQVCAQLRGSMSTDHTVARREVSAMLDATQKLASTVADGINLALPRLAEVTVAVEHVDGRLSDAARLSMALEDWFLRRNDIIRRLESQQKLRDGHLYQDQERRIAHLEEQVRRLTDENAGLRAGQPCQDVAAATEIEALHAELALRKLQAGQLGDIQQHNEELQALSARLEETVASCRAEVNHLTTNGKALRSQVAQLQDQLQAQAAATDNAETRNRRLEESEQTLRAQLEQLEASGAHDPELQRSLSATREVEERLRDDNARLQQRVATLSGQAERLAQENASSTAQLEHATGAADVLRQQLAGLEEELAGLRRQLHSYRERTQQAEEGVIQYHEALVAIVQQTHPTGGTGVNLEQGQGCTLPATTVEIVNAFVARHGALRMEADRLRAGGATDAPAPEPLPAADAVQPVAVTAPVDVPAAPAAAAAAAAAAADPMETGIAQLREFGFTDEDAMRDALEQSRGDVRLAANILIS